MTAIKTPLFQTHVDLGAKMVPFAGYEMPMQYAGIVEEHMSVRKKAGLFDVSHMGEFIVKGKEADLLVQSISSNDCSKLDIGAAQYAYIPNLSGGIIDDMIVYRLEEDRCADGEKAFMLVVNASNREKDIAWIKEHNTFECTVEDISDNCGLLALQGPLVNKILSELTDVDLEQISFYHHKKGSVAGLDQILISATGYTGSGGFELYCRNDQMQKLWNAIMVAGEKHGLAPCGLGARDTLRLEMGYCLYGNDIDEESNPFEAGLMWITKLKKEPFLAGPFLTDLKAKGKTKQLKGLRVEGRRVPRKDYPVVNANGQKIGEVTSGTYSPCLESSIAMAYVNMESIKSEEEIFIDFGRKQAKASFCKFPFIDPTKYID